jgi:hypothetical protein
MVGYGTNKVWLPRAESCWEAFCKIASENCFTYLQRGQNLTYKGDIILFLSVCLILTYPDLSNPIIGLTPR